MIIKLPNTPESIEKANALRNECITTNRGCLIIREESDGEPVHQLEKIIAGHPLRPGMTIDDIRWKNDPAIILIGKASKYLDIFEQMVPGFVKRFK